MIKRFQLFLALLLVSVIPLAGGSTGKIKGKIIDDEMQQSLIGVNVYLDGTATVSYTHLTLPTSRSV